MGSSPFAAAILSHLLHHHKNNMQMVAVYTQPAKEKGRGKKITKTDVAILAEQHGVPVRTPTLFHDEEIDFIARNQPDLIIVAAYGLLLPAGVLSLPSIMALNVHPSLLPHYRGATPIESAILAGDKKTGVCFIKMTPELDAGDVLAMQSMPLAEDDNRETLSNKLLSLSLTMFDEHLPSILEKKFQATPQDHTTASFCQKIKKSDYEVKPSNEPADMVDRKIRAYYPKCFLPWSDGKRLGLLSVKKTNQPSNGRQDILFEDGKISLPCRDNLLELILVKPENKKAMMASDWWRGLR